MTRTHKRMAGRQYEALTCIGLAALFVAVWLPTLQRLRLQAVSRGHLTGLGVAKTLGLSLALSLLVTAAIILGAGLIAAAAVGLAHRLERGGRK